VQNTTESDGGGSSENTTTTVQEKPTEAPTTSAPKGVTPDSVETKDGIEKATYTTSERTYIVYYMSELLTHNSEFPVVSWANGTGCAPSLYDGLLREVAKGGFIVVASDETMAADGTAQIDAIDFVITESINKSSTLYKKVDLEKIAVFGHSQGGRSSVNAGAMDDRIACVLSLAGSNYFEEAEKLSKPVLFMAGSKDKIVDAEKWLVTAYNAVKGPATYASLNGAIHTTCCSNPTAYSRYAISWFNAWFYNDNNYKDMFKDGGELSSDSAWTGFMSKGF
jgi:pimeloyl-ACP methyl ester carboxylesterase